MHLDNRMKNTVAVIGDGVFSGIFGENKIILDYFEYGMI